MTAQAYIAGQATLANLDLYHCARVSDVRDVDIDAFLALAVELLAPHCSRLRSVYRDQFSKWSLTPEERAAGVEPGHCITAEIKTGRACLHGNDWDGMGTARPSGDLEGNAKALAAAFGLTCSAFDYCEKGWGFYHFEVAA